jgi:hypothetical protein
MSRDYTLTEATIQYGIVLAVAAIAVIKHLLIPWIRGKIDKDLS